MTNLELVKKGYQLIGEGNVEGFIAPWLPGMEWSECKGFPYVVGDGIYVGANEILGGVFAKLPEWIDGFDIDVNDFVDGGDKIVMVGFYTGTWKPTGKKFRANATHTWTVKEGKISHFFQAVDTAEIVNP